MRILYLISVLALTGCAPKYAWYNPGIDPSSLPIGSSRSMEPNAKPSRCRQ